MQDLSIYTAHYIVFLHTIHKIEVEQLGGAAGDSSDLPQMNYYIKDNE